MRLHSSPTTRRPASTAEVVPRVRALEAQVVSPLLGPRLERHLARLGSASVHRNELATARPGMALCSVSAISAGVSIYSECFIHLPPNANI